MKDAGESMASICETLKLKRATVYKALAEEPEVASVN
jgi:DNA-binding phage protein